MSSFLPVLLLCWLHLGDGLPHINLSPNYANRDAYYIRKTPKLKENPEKVSDFFISWFPMYDLQRDPNEKQYDPDKNHILFNLYPEYITTKPLYDNEKSTKSSNFSKTMKKHYKKIKEFTGIYIPKTWKTLKTGSKTTVKKIKLYANRKRLKEVFINITHPLRYRGSKNYVNRTDPYTYLGPRVKIHPKSSYVEVIKTSSTEYPIRNFHYSVPRRIKVLLNFKRPERHLKTQRHVNDKYLAGEESDSGNSTTVLETAGEMASDLAGKVTSLWHCVLGNHRVPEPKDVRFYLYTRRNVIIPELLNVNFELIKEKKAAIQGHVDIECVDIPPESIPNFERVSDENRRIIRSNYLNIKAPTKILIHGYTGSYKDSRMAKIKDAYLDNGRYNVIQVDWEILAAPPCYIRVTHHSKFVGELIAKFLDGLYLVGLNMSLVHLVGFSLGAQVAGFVGNNATITPICRITGLDPALPLFLHTDPAGRLDRLDAKFVDVIHTCGGILAMLDPLGHVDFYPNGGTKQPGCEFSNLKCSHSRAPQYFAESVVSKKKFTGQLCQDWEEYVEAKGHCTNNNTTVISFMGEPCSRKSTFGKYYLLTKSKEPFVL